VLSNDFSTDSFFMKQIKVTARQVAEHAGVSQTTVSFVLNHVLKANISEATRDRVLRTAQELGYVPDVAARSLARGRSSTIGLVISHPHAQVFRDEYMPNILTGISQVTRESNYHILVEMVDAVCQTNTHRTMLKSKEVMGLIVQLYSPTQEDIIELRSLASAGFPIVSLSVLDSQISAVTMNSFVGVRKIVEHLIGLGHQHIGCISYAPQGRDPEATGRMDVYQQTLRDAGIDPDPAFVRFGEYDPDTGYREMQALLRLDPRPTAIFAMNDVMAFGAIAAITEAGLRVPDDIAVVGFDDVRLARYTMPALTTVRAPDVERGKQAARMLLGLIEGQVPTPLHLELGTEIVIRESCGCRQYSRP
jgi:LacI family transcriptional regulator